MMKPIDLNQLKSYDLASRPSQLFAEELGKPCDSDVPSSEWIHSLPRRPVTESLRAVHDHLQASAENKRPVVVGVPSSFFLAGCSPYLIDWINRGVVQGVAMDGQAAFHDLELALGGKTGEDKLNQVPSGKFGMAREAADVLAVCAYEASKDSKGLGSALGDYLCQHPCESPDASVLRAASQANIPCTIHLSIGADPIAMQSHIAATPLTEAALLDFRRFCSMVATLQNGTWFEFGSSTLSEVFCHAVSAVRNLGTALDEMTVISMGDATSQAIHDKLASQHYHLPGPVELCCPLLHQTLACRSTTEHEDLTMLPYAA